MDSRKTGKTKINFCGKEIDIDEENSERLPTEVIKIKWRKEMILAQQIISRKIAQDQVDKKIRLQWPWNSESFEERSRLKFKFESECPSESTDLTDDTSSDLDIFVEQFPCSSHAVWSGWLRFKDAGISAALFSSWKAWWCVLNLDRTQLRLDFIFLDSAIGLSGMSKSIVLDPSNGISFEKSALACNANGRLSITEQGTGRRHRAKCESPEEAERLHRCAGSLLRTLVRRGFTA